MKIVNYLNVTLDLYGNSFQPYSKCDNELNYVNYDFNHPSSVIKRLPRTIELRLSSTSSKELILDNATSPYKEAFKKADYKSKLTLHSVRMWKQTMKLFTSIS